MRHYIQVYTSILCTYDLYATKILLTGEPLIPIAPGRPLSPYNT